MSQAYRSFFGFTREPFSSELKVEEILQTEAVLAVANRVNYAIRLEEAPSWNSIVNWPGNWRQKPQPIAGPA